MSDPERHAPLLYQIIRKAFCDIIESDKKKNQTSSEFLNNIIKNHFKNQKIENIFSHDKGKKEERDRRINKVEIALKKELSFYELSNNSSNPVEETKQVFEQLKKYLDTIDNTKNLFFLPAETLSSFLFSYYALFRYLFSDTILLDEKIGSCLAVSDFFALFPGKYGESLYTPYAAESTLKLYKALDDANRFCKDEKNKGINQIVQKMIESIYATKTFRDYRRIIIKDGKQYLISCENTDKLNLKNISDLSSIEMVKPIRLFGKIKRYIYALEQDKNTQNITCRIKIIGTVYIEPDSIDSNELRAYSPELYDLCSWISNNYQKDELIQQFQIDVHINKNSLDKIQRNEDYLQSMKCLYHDLDERIKVRFHFDDYAKLSSKEGLDELMDNTETLLFFLDCPFLYDNLHIVSHDQHLYDWVHSLPASYPDESLSLAELGPVQKYQNQLNMFLLYRNESTAHFERRLRDRRIKYISDKVKNIKKDQPNNKTEVFIFISSQSSIDGSEYARTFQIRKEEYNSKEMCLLHFGREKGDSGDSFSCAEDDDFKNKIRFSLWNILVNTDPALIEEIKEYFGLKNVTVAEDLASEMYIVFCWKRIHPFSEVELQISCSKQVISKIKENSSQEITGEKLYDEFGEQFKSIIASYFDVIFSNSHDLDPTILKCMRNSFYNIFFGRISNVFHAIAFNRIQAALESGRPIAITEINVKKEPLSRDEFEKNEEKDNNERDFVTKRTKAYVGVIDNLSKAYPSPTLRDILVARMRAAGMLPQEVYDKIIMACEKSDYTDDELYQNTIMARSDLL